jgi:molybdate transport system regulatory protein
MATSAENKLHLRARLLHGDEIAMGPGKADLLDAIAKHGSISAAANSMNMSYRRAWLLVDTMNRCFEEPLVIAATGGKMGGGAHLSNLGAAVLKDYRAMMSALEKTGASHFQKLKKYLSA